MSTRYWAKDQFHEVFVFLYEELESLGEGEALPDYEYDGGGKGLQELYGIWYQAFESGYYTELFEQAAYVFCSIATGHHFSNGNKRLAVAVLSLFLVSNGYLFHLWENQKYYCCFKKYFPNFSPLEEEDLTGMDTFTYWLARIASDKSLNGDLSFGILKEKVEALLRETCTPIRLLRKE